MSLKIRALRLSVTTPNGPFGARLTMDSGLVVLRADNSSGKSTCIQGIIYALGLEGMLSASHDVPLAHAMTTAIFDPRVGAEVPVESSFVEIEIENQSGKVLTTRRYAKHPTISRDLVTVWEDAAITQDPVGSPVDYFVRRPGAAQREAGFHRRLAEFLGWQLPLVATFDESPKPLYLETLFPLFVVEQKRGWSGIQAQVPTQFRIRDVRRRALEYVLHLASAEAAAQLEEAQRQATLISQEWRDRRSVLLVEARSAGAMVSNLPTRPPAQWPITPAPTITLPIGDTWVGLESELASARVALSETSQQPVSTAGDGRAESTAELAQLDRQLRTAAAIAANEAEQISQEEAQLTAAEARLGDLDADLRRHQDLVLLRQLGGQSESPGIIPHECPTCHQDLPATVLDESTRPRVMTVDESIRAIEQERQFFRDLVRDGQRTLEAKQARMNALRVSANEMRARISAIRTALTEADHTPSEADIEKRLGLRSRVQRLSALADAYATHMTEFERLAIDWTNIQSRIDLLRSADSKTADEGKRRVLERALLEQLAAYRFSSVAVESLSISSDTWLPTHDGFDLGFDLSASDMIRLIWAYLLALLELDRVFDLNHTGLVIFDEPRQQMASPESFSAFVRRASVTREYGQQVIVATSEGRSELDQMLHGNPAQVIDFGTGKILAPEAPN